MELFTPQQIKNLNELELLVYQYIIASEHGALHAHPGVGSGSARFHHHSAALLQKRWAVTVMRNSNGS